MLEDLELAAIASSLDKLATMAADLKTAADKYLDAATKTLEAAKIEHADTVLREKIMIGAFIVMALSELIGLFMNGCHRG